MKTFIKRWGLLLAYVIFILCFLSWATGCTHWSYTHVSYDSKGNVTDYVEALGQELLMRSSIDGVHVLVEEGKRELTIGKIDRDPDAEVIGGIIAGVIKGLK